MSANNTGTVLRVSRGGSGSVSEPLGRERPNSGPEAPIMLFAPLQPAGPPVGSKSDAGAFTGGAHVGADRSVLRTDLTVRE